MSRPLENKSENNQKFVKIERQLQEQDSVIFFHDEDEDFSGGVVFVTGHMFDHPDRANARFPEENVGLVRNAIRSFLDDENRKAPVDKVLCSGTAGADLLAAEWALDNEVSVVLYLPYDETAFVTGAVAYSESQGKTMKSIFDKVKSDPDSSVYTPYLANGEVATKEKVEEASKKLGDPYRHYADLNKHMVEKLKGEDMVLAVWDGKGGDSPGGTEHAVRTAVEGGANFRIINDGIINIADTYPDIS